MAQQQPRLRSRPADLENEYEDLYNSTEIDSPDEPTQMGMSRSERLAAGRAMASNQGGSAMDMASSGMMMSGNPYAMGAGVGLKVLAANERRKQQEKQAQWEAKQARIERQSAAIDKLINVSNSLRNL